MEFSDWRLPNAPFARPEYESYDVQRDARRVVPSFAIWQRQRRVADVGALGTQHPRDVADIPGDREIRQGHRDLKRRSRRVDFFPPSLLTSTSIRIVIIPRVVPVYHCYLGANKKIGLCRAVGYLTALVKCVTDALFDISFCCPSRLVFDAVLVLRDARKLEAMLDSLWSLSSVDGNFAH